MKGKRIGEEENEGESSGTVGEVVGAECMERRSLDLKRRSASVVVAPPIADRLNAQSRDAPTHTFPGEQTAY